MKKTVGLFLAVLLCGLTLLPLGGCGGSAAPDYDSESAWVYRESDVTGKDADVFFLAPSSFGGKAGGYLMDLSNEGGRKSFAAGVLQEKGVYDDNARFFAPYYRQVGYKAYVLPEEERLGYLETAFADVQAAFAHYMEQDNEGRPFLLAGFSEGAELCLRLVKEALTPEQLDRMVACYAIGWRVTDQDLQDYPSLHLAQGETDTGVIITYNTETPEAEDSPMVPAGTRTNGINPLNWRTDSTPADKSLNLGYCWVNGEGGIDEEVPQLTGATLDPDRGTLKVTDIDLAVYDKTISILPEGVTHLYDVAFFYRNLEQNVQDRIAAYLAAH